MVYKFWKKKIANTIKIKDFEKLKIEIELDNELDEPIKAYFIRGIEAEIRTLMLNKKLGNGIPKIDEKTFIILTKRFEDNSKNSMKNISQRIIEEENINAVQEEFGEELNKTNIGNRIKKKKIKNKNLYK